MNEGAVSFSGAQPVQERWLRCSQISADQDIGRFRGSEHLYHPSYRDADSGQWKPYYDESNRKWQGFLIEPEDIAPIDSVCKALLDYVRSIRFALRTIPPRSDITFSDQEPSSWDVYSTIAMVHNRGLLHFRFLDVSDDKGSPKFLERSKRTDILEERYKIIFDAGERERWVRALYARGERVDAKPWQNTAGNSFLVGVSALYSTLFDKVLDWLRAEDNSTSIIWRRSIYLAYGIAALVSVPVTSIYHNFHGTAAVEKVEPALDGATQHVLAMLRDWSTALRYIADEIPSQYEEIMKGLLLERSQVGCAVYSQAIEIEAPYRRLLGGFIEQPAQASFTILPQKENKARQLSFTRRVVAGARDPEILWARESAWQYLQGAANMVSQAGFILMINAANNHWGGKHPPHIDHRDGRCFDLDIAIPNKPGVIDGGYTLIPNLAKMQWTPNKDGRWVDEVDGKRYDLTPQRGEKGPRTLVGVQRLALWVVLQALQLAGIETVLFADKENMDLALAHLAARIPSLRGGFASTQQKSSMLSPLTSTSLRSLTAEGTGTRQFLEPTGHYNHLHVRTLPTPQEEPQDGRAVAVPDPPLHTTYTQLYEWALQRDADINFLDLMFSKEEQTSAIEEPYKEWWLKRSSAKPPEPSLLPVWLPSKEKLK